MVKLVSYSKDYMEQILGALEKCYGIRPNSLEKAISAGHLSVLEHAYASFDIECSLAVLGQITRHRHFGFTVASTRGRIMNKYYLPDEVQGYDSVVALLMNDYHDAINSEQFSKQHAAYLLPKATLTELRMTGNLRAWFEYLGKRLCNRAMPEHKDIAQQICTQLAFVMPEIFSRNFLNCENCKESGCEF